MIECEYLSQDFDGKYLGSETPKARKEHKCRECGCTIRPGEHYVLHHGVWDDGTHWRVKSCTVCERVGRSIFRCGWPLGELWSYIHDIYCDQELCLCPERS